MTFRKKRICRDCKHIQRQVSPHCSKCGGIMKRLKPPIFRR